MHIPRYFLQRLAVIASLCGTMSAVRAQQDNSKLTLLEPQTVSRMWSFIKDKTQAPADLPIPPIVVDESLPKNVRLMFEYPSQ